MSNLAGKRAVVFGAGGSIGAAVAKQFASEGAEVFVSGRTLASVAELARAVDGRADAVDALDEAAVGAYLEKIGRIDAVFNAVGPRASEYGNGKNAVDLGAAEFMVPLETIVKSAFITARAAARRMVKQRSGVILFVTGSPARGHVEGATAIGAAFGAIETLMENLAFEVSPHGVRALCVRTIANTDSRTIQNTMDVLSEKLKVPREQMIAQIAGQNLLKTTASILDTARVAAFLVSDRARMMTGTVVNATAGAALD